MKANVAMLEFPIHGDNRDQLIVVGTFYLL